LKPNFAASHGLGKANNRFQVLVSGIARNTVLRQAVRHEWVSWYILQEPQLKKWIISHFDDATKEIDWQILLWSITGHHPAFRREIPSGSPNGSSDKMDLLLGHSDVGFALQLTAKQLGEIRCPFNLHPVRYRPRPTSTNEFAAHWQMPKPSGMTGKATKKPLASWQR